MFTIATQGCVVTCYVIKLPSDQVEWLRRRYQWSEDAVIQVSVWFVFTLLLLW